MQGHVLIAGATASGKSALAVAVARRIGGMVVNADSMQVYRDLRVITARPSIDEEGQSPHRLFGTVDGAVNFSVGHFLREVEALLESRTSPLVFVGGTGLYFKALTQGLSDIPAVPADVRTRVRGEAQGRPPADLHAELAACDPAMAARLRPSDPQRILRALEVYEATGRSLLSFQDARQAPLLAPGSYRGVFLDVPREELRERIAARFHAMMEAGALEEVRALAMRYLDPALPVMRAHGVPGLLAYLAGETSLDEAIARAISDTQRYAKRQVTFARHQLPELDWIGPEAALAMLV